jgi:hypothetical protein
MEIISSILPDPSTALYNPASTVLAATALSGVGLSLKLLLSLGRLICSIRTPFLSRMRSATIPDDLSDDPEQTAETLAKKFENIDEEGNFITFKR